MFHSWYAHGGKRVLDVAAASMALAVSWPVMAAVALAVRTRLGAPVLFRQRRPGRDGQVFSITKFRTMTDARDPQGRLRSDGDRLTPLGRWLRRTSLDELPELYDVLRGEMSLVGPRPLLERYRPFYTERERLRERVRPGITGLAQVSGRNHAPWHERLEADARYVETLSLRGDLRILAQTAAAVFTARGVEEDARAAMLDLDASRRTEVVPLGPEHAEAIVSLHRAAFDEHTLQTTIFVGHGVAAYYADVLHDAEHRALGVWGGERLLGYAHIRDRDGHSHLNQIATAGDARSRGIGRRLLEAWLAQSEGARCSLDVTEGSRAAAWYRRHGFDVRGRCVLWRVPAAAGKGVALEETSCSRSWQRRYGFSTVGAQVGGQSLELGRLGAHDLRVEGSVDSRTLDVLREVRRLIVVGGADAPHPDATPLRTVLHMERAPA